MAASKEELASQALNRLGEPAISSFDEDTDAAEKVGRLYEETILALLSSYPWQWATTRAVLSIDGAITPANKWRYAYKLPTLQLDRVGNPLRFYNSTDLRAPVVDDYELEGEHVFTNYTTMVAEYIQRKNENLWPGYFAKLARDALAADLALPITESRTKEEYFQTLAFGTPSEEGQGGLMARAMKSDIIGTPTASLLDESDPITSARFGGVRRSSGQW
ncbi:tail protein [Dunaliella viridis virus SI2]|uniref:tail protein n=1 Tax=Dunaliella viridis virus SI2 TaxID=754069 RepID=UPI0002C0FFBC|nr:tail protein [Dunaliella viridis virus SI2]AGH15990.1 hypothetical protein DVVG_00004 [Dunaliella viridis virus SI2]